MGKNWIKDVTEHFDLTSNTQVGVVQYSYWYRSRSVDEQTFLKTEIELSNFDDKDDFDTQVDAIKYQSYSGNTAHGIMKTIREDFNGSQGRYPEARRVMVIVTDDQADDADYMNEAIEMANENDVKMF